MIHSLKAERVRVWRKRAENQNMKLFYRDHGGAETFLRKKIMGARRSVVIIDPYFSTNEFFAYALAVTMRGVSIEIITSAKHLKEKSRLQIYDEVEGESGRGDDGAEPQSAARPELGTELQRQVKAYEEKGMGKILVYVMTGDKPVIHDRFLIVDGEAWFCGGSFNEIGNRLSCLMRMQDSDELIRIVEEMVHDDQILDLETWVERRNE